MFASTRVIVKKVSRGRGLTMMVKVRADARCCQKGVGVKGNVKDDLRNSQDGIITLLRSGKLQET